MQNYTVCPHCGKFLFKDDEKSIRCAENGLCSCYWCGETIDEEYLDNPENWR